MLSRNQQTYISANRPANFLVVGTTALTCNKLMWGGDELILYTPWEELDHIPMCDMRLEHYHFSDGDYCSLMDQVNNLWLPTAERALVDTINFLEKNYIEGPLIESLQTYLEKNKDLSELYAVADHYGVSRDKINYWIDEAREESDMSMG